MNRGVSAVTIIRARLSAELTQTEAAALVHTSKGSWENWEQGRCRMPPGLFELFQLKVGQAELRAPSDQAPMHFQEIHR